jgi:hypothetical protein
MAKMPKNRTRVARVAPGHAIVAEQQGAQAAQGHSPPIATQELEHGITSSFSK